MDGQIVLNYNLTFPNYHRQMQCESQGMFRTYKLQLSFKMESVGINASHNAI